MSMANRSRSPMTTDFYNIVGVTTTSSIKEICKAYKSLMKWTADKNHDHKSSDLKQAYDKVISRFDQEEPLRISEPTTTTTTKPTTIVFDRHKSVDDSFFFSRAKNSMLSRNTSRRSKTPTPNSTSYNNSHRNGGSDNDTDLSDHSSRGRRRGATAETTHIRASSSAVSSPSRRRRSGGGGGKRRSSTATPIVFSQSTARKKPPPLESRLECTLEELLDGCVKKIRITRDVITDSGMIVQEEEMLWVNVKPGWGNGTKITLEGRGDEKPGYLPADIILSIDEIRHPLYEREGDDLELVVEIPLVNALTGCSIPVPLLGGDKMTLSFDDIIHPGYQKVIKGQGMPKAKEQGKRGDLQIKFLIEFPVQLSSEQRAEAAGILRGCS